MVVQLNAQLILIAALLGFFGCFSFFAALERAQASVRGGYWQIVAAFGLAGGIFSLQFIALEAVQFAADIYFQPWPFMLSIFGTLFGALWVTRRWSQRISHPLRRFLTGVVLGCSFSAVCAIGVTSLVVNGDVVVPLALTLKSTLLCALLMGAIFNICPVLQSLNISRFCPYIRPYLTPLLLSLVMIVIQSQYLRALEIAATAAPVSAQGLWPDNIISVVVGVVALLVCGQAFLLLLTRSEKEQVELVLHNLRTEADTRFWRLLLPGLVILLVVMFGILNSDNQRHNDGLQQQAQVVANEIVEEFSQEIASLVQETGLIAAEISVLGIGEQRYFFDQGRVISLFHLHMANDKRIDHIRLVSMDGHELIKVDRSAEMASIETVSAELLQDVSASDNFSRLADYRHDDFLIGDLDKNSEHIQAEWPYLYVLPIATPVTAADGMVLGYLVIDFSADLFIRKVDDLINAFDGQVAISVDGKVLMSRTDLNPLFGFGNYGNTLNTVITPSMYLGSNLAEKIFTINYLDSKSASTQWEVLVANEKRHWLLSFLQSSVYSGLLLVIPLLLWFAAARFIAFALTLRELSKRKIESLMIELENHKFAADEHAIVSITDTNGVITYANQKFCDISGYSQQEILGKTHRILKSGEHDAAFYQQLWETILNREVWQGELKNRTRDGGYYWVYATIVPLTNDKGDIQQFYSIRTDITYIKEIEAQLSSALEKEHEAALAKSHFLANMSHEIRTPMNAVVGLTEICLESGLQGQQRDYVDKAHKAALGLLGVINGILDFSKIEAGHVPLEQVEFSIADVLNQLLVVLSESAARKNIELVISQGFNQPEWLLGDQVRLTQVLINLVSNAIKFTHEGFVLVKLDLEQQDADSVAIRFCVEDSGIGLPDEKLATIFEPFTQADASTTRKYGGTGLGLSICKGIVEAMGGQIAVSSQPDRGSQFSFTLRFLIAEQQALPRKSASLISGKRVLVVDDNELARDVLVGYLRACDCYVAEASSGSRAIEMVAAADHGFDVVLMDWQMPHMDGLTAAENISALALPAARHPAMIMVSTASEAEILKRPESCHIHSVLRKPVTPSTLLDSLMRLFSGQASGGLAQNRPTEPALGRSDPALVTPEAEPAPDHRGIRLLVVDDNEVNRLVARTMLQKQGYRVDVAESAEQALTMITPGCYRVLLVDIQMAEMSGHQLTRLLRRDPQYQQQIIIAMTAHAAEEERQACLASGMNDHIAKPITMAGLQQVLSRWLPVDVKDHRQSPPALKGLTCVDEPAGIGRMGGDADSYYQLLRKFRDLHTLDGEKLLMLAQERDESGLRRHLHMLEGVCSNIGASRLVADINAMNANLAKGSIGALEGAAAEFEYHFSMLIAEIETVVSSEPPAPPDDDEFDLSSLTQELMSLQSCLQAYDAAADGLVKALLAHALPEKLRSRLTDISELIDRYDYEQAEMRLASILEIAVETDTTD